MAVGFRACEVGKSLPAGRRKGHICIVSEHRLPHDRNSVPMARSMASNAVADSLQPTERDNFLLMVSELVSNAIRHAPPEPDGRIVLRLDVEDAKARAVVIDGGRRFDFDRATFDPKTPHFGLMLVDQLANRWGLSLEGEKAVWFEIGTGDR
jgi:two-component sensor histidine kinase